MTTSRPSRSAFTLVEVVLALGLAAAVLTLVARIAVQSLNLTHAIDGQIETRRQHEYWADRLDRDIASAIERSRLVTADLDAHGRPRIRVLALTSDAGAEDKAHQTPAEVTYRVLMRDNRLRLVRESRSLLRSQPITREETVGCGMKSVDVELRIDGAWQAAGHAGKNPPRPMPDAIRVTILWPDAENPTQRTWQLRHKADRSPTRER